MVITKDRPIVSRWLIKVFAWFATIALLAVFTAGVFLSFFWYFNTYERPFFYVVKQTVEAPCNRDSSEELMCTWVRHSYRTRNQVTLLCVGGYCEAVAK